jgi:hypothetical protein
LRFGCCCLFVVVCLGVVAVWAQPAAGAGLAAWSWAACCGARALPPVPAAPAPPLRAQQVRGADCRGRAPGVLWRCEVTRRAQAQGPRAGAHRSRKPNGRGRCGARGCPAGAGRAALCELRLHGNRERSLRRAKRRHDQTACDKSRAGADNFAHTH